MSPAEKKTLVESYDRWYHAFDFGDGVISKPVNDMPDIWAESEAFIKDVDFAGKSVLDIGCWDGYWSFYAERQGATEVLATDIVDQRWGTPRGLEIAHQIYDSRVNYRGDVSVYNLTERIEKRYDIVIFFGVYYHLTHIMYAFSQLRHVVKEGGLVLVEGAAIDDLERSYCEFLYGEGPEPERTDKSNWCVPTRKCLMNYAESSYFRVRREHYPFQGYSRARALMEVEAVVRQDDNHMYPPSFGLQQYDPRWRE